ncbi:hypothetical protein AQUCO_08900003v1 [Aquilegia coerulea]|uniref:Uncharacterized protein n=1 Tax=Aquilegia coerulea TaxID=218851 RepID=A0A2G5C648_AQUCA|nr:hypothetical protein AQUCO_08900003v1 [Aquilegia coerulea]
MDHRVTKYYPHHIVTGQCSNLQWQSRGPCNEEESRHSAVGCLLTNIQLYTRRNKSKSYRDCSFYHSAGYEVQYCAS